MRKSAVLFLSAMFFLCAGCVDPNQYTGLNWEPQQPPHGYATVYVYHSNPNNCHVRTVAKKASHRWQLILDGVPNKHLKPNTFLSYTLTPGHYTIKLDIDPSKNAEFTAQPTLDIKVSSGDIKFVRFDYELPGSRYLGYTAPEKSLIVVPFDNAVTQLRNCQLVWAPVYQFAPPGWGQSLQPGFISSP